MKSMTSNHLQNLLIYSFKAVTMQRNEIIYQQDAVGKYLYIVQTGQTVLLKKLHKADLGLSSGFQSYPSLTFPLSQVGPLQFLGDEILQKQQSRETLFYDFTAKVTSPEIELYRIDIADLQKYYKEVTDAILLNYQLLRSNWDQKIKQSLLKYQYEVQQQMQEDPHFQGLKQTAEEKPQFYAHFSEYLDKYNT